MLDIDESNMEEHLPIGVETCLQMLQEAVDDYGPGWVDPRSVNEDTRCMNAYEHEDGSIRYCIGGYVFVHNFTFVDFGWFEENLCVSGPTGTVIEEIEDWLVVEGVKKRAFTFEAASLLNGIQRLQDGGVPWGEALDFVSEHKDLLDDDYDSRDFFVAIEDRAEEHVLATT